MAKYINDFRQGDTVKIKLNYGSTTDIAGYSYTFTLKSSFTLTDEEAEFFHSHFGIHMGAKSINDSRIIFRISRYDGDNKFILSIKEYMSKGIKLTEKQILGAKKVFIHLDTFEDVELKNNKDFQKWKYTTIAISLKTGKKISPNL